MRSQINKNFQLADKGIHCSDIGLWFNHLDGHCVHSFFRISDANSFRFDNPSKASGSNLDPCSNDNQLNKKNLTKQDNLKWRSEPSVRRFLGNSHRLSYGRDSIWYCIGKFGLIPFGFPPSLLAISSFKFFFSFQIRGSHQTVDKPLEYSNYFWWDKSSSE